ATTSIYAQIEKNLGDFNELKVYDRIEVELIKSDSNKVIITGKNTEGVVLVNKNGTLKIRMSVPKIFNGDDTTVQLYYTTIDSIDDKEGTVICCNDVIKQYNSVVNTQEGGHDKL